MNRHVGCSGFSYQDWKEKFYPSSVPQNFWFEYYCQFFNTVELNVTFYRIPRPSVIKGWYKRSPDDFIFTVKAPRIITHYKKFESARDEAKQFYDQVLDGLGNKLGTVLFQLHPRMEYSEETLERIFRTIDPFFKNVIEFRHASWWREEVIEKLRDEKITFCSISYPHLPDHIINTSGVLYYRLHGVPRLYRTLYPSGKLEQIIEAISNEKNVNDVYIYFNNDYDANAIKNALEVQEMLNA